MQSEAEFQQEFRRVMDHRKTLDFPSDANNMQIVKIMRFGMLNGYPLWPQKTSAAAAKAD